MRSPIIRFYGAALLALAGACAGSTEPTSRPVPAAMQVVSGDPQSGAAGTELAQPLVAKVVDAAGVPIRGQVVNFRVTAGGGSVFAGTATTSASGIAQERWTLGTVAGVEQTVEARAVDNETGIAVIFATFHATATAGAPATMTIVSGDQQSAAAGAPLPDSLLVRVVDRYDNPVQGLAVTWAAPGEAGTITPATSTTSATGHASAKWTAGAAAGSYQVRASVPATATPPVPPVDFRATVVAAAPAAIVKIAGDAQTVNPGTAVPVAPSVRVTDQLNPVAGATVVFAVATGGGSVAGGTTTTNASGIATVGGWTLGSASGANTLIATVNGVSTTFTATARWQSSDVSVIIDSPTANALAGDTLNVSARVSSTYQVASVRAIAAGRQADLALGSGSWTGSLSLAGLPRDTVSVIVRATDIKGAVSETIVVVNHDRGPTLTFVSPLGYAVARPTLDLGASCTDDDPAGCKSVVARLRCVDNEYACPYTNGAVLASGTTSVGTISLAAYEGQKVELSITATDSRGQSVTSNVGVFVESSAKLAEVVRVPGRAWDYRGGRTLYSEVKISGDRCGDRYNYTGTAVRDASGAVQVIPFSRPLFPRRSVLMAAGAIGADASSFNQVMEWRDGTVRETPLTSYSAFDANDRFAAFASGGKPNSAVPLYRRNLTTGVDELVTSAVPVYGDSPGTICNAMNADVAREPNFRVAPNGDVVYISTGGLYRFRDGTSTLVKANGWSPVTDGINVVFQNAATSSTYPSTYETVLWDGTSETVLASGEPAMSYAVFEGWTAFIKSDVNGALQAWTRSPSGTLQKVTAFGASFKIEAVGPDGSVIGTVGRKRYAVSPTGTATEVGSSQGVVLSYREGGFFVLLGQLVLRITP
jgi:hypothetical protein